MPEYEKKMKKMISRIDHVSIAVKDIEAAVKFFTEIFDAVPGAGETDPDMKYSWRVFSLGDLSRLELLNATGEGSFLDNFFRKNSSGGVHHITLETPDIQEAARSLRSHDVPFFGLNDQKGDWKELFIHPKDAFGVLIQIAEFNPEEYLDSSVKLSPGQRWRVEKTKKGACLKFAHPGGGAAKIKMNRSEIAALIEQLRQVI